MAMIFGGEEAESKQAPAQGVADIETETKNSNNEADEKARLAAEQKAKEEEAARLAAEKKAKEEEAARLAAEQKAKEEAARIAAEQKAKEAEAARLAAERKAQEEAAAKAAAANVYYQNCSAVRAAGAAPICTGDPGYSRKLDRDGDGIGCE